MLSRASGRNPAEDSDTDSPAPLLAFAFASLPFPLLYPFPFPLDSYDPAPEPDLDPAPRASRLMPVCARPYGRGASPNASPKSIFARGVPSAPAMVTRGPCVPGLPRA